MMGSVGTTFFAKVAEYSPQDPCSETRIGDSVRIWAPIQNISFVFRYLYSLGHAMIGPKHPPVVKSSCYHTIRTRIGEGCARGLEFPFPAILGEALETQPAYLSFYDRAFIWALLGL